MEWRDFDGVVGMSEGVHTCSWLFECKECERIDRRLRLNDAIVAQKAAESAPHRHDARWTAVYAAAMVSDWHTDGEHFDSTSVGRHVWRAELLADTELEVRLARERAT